jgi:UDP-glucose 4-epimerase
LTETVSWVVGCGGLLGRRVESVLAERGSTWRPSTGFAWGDPSVVSSQIEESCNLFAEGVGELPWKVVWCAGAGVVDSGPAELRGETEVLRQLLGGLVRAMGPRRMRSGALFLASSAGGVYAGSSGAPYSELSDARPLAPYGWNKLEQESLVRRWSSEHGTPALIGRLSNLYGPGQNLSKNQGLISQVCRRVLAHQPLMLDTPLDTIRDYLFVDDAGLLIADGLERLGVERSNLVAPPVVIKVLASKHPTTIATVLGEVRRVTKRPVRVVLARSHSARHQAPDLRMTSVVWPQLDERSMTTLSAGTWAVVNDILGELQLRRSG